MEKNLAVRGEFIGAIAMEGYQAEPLEFQPELITVSGPETRLAAIESAVVLVQRENLTKTTVEDLPFTLRGGDGSDIDAEGLTFSHQSVAVTIPIKMVREVPLTVAFIHGAGTNERNVSYTVAPEYVTLSGEPADMQLNYILLGTIDLTGFSASLTENFQIIVPNELNNLTGLTDAAVTVKINGLETVQLSATNIQATNVPEGYDAALITQSLDVIIRGEPEDVDPERLQPSNIRVVADLSELGSTSGTYTVTARVYVDGDFGDVGAIGEYRVTVALSESGPVSGGDERE
jgi:YbbR domain-containing protein